MIAWKLVGNSALNLLKASWPLLVAAGLALFLAHKYYFEPKIEKLEAEVTLAVNERDDARQIIEEQNTAILKLSETASKVTEEVIGNLEDKLNDMSDENRRIIESILDEGVPEGCEASRQFLIQMINQLQWREENDE